MATKIRVFKPASKYCGKTTIETVVQRWIWISGSGVICEHKAGYICKSDYCLKELIEGNEAIEIKNQ